eukprot:TRINITY_DN9785_c0_g1_i1.p1 TRINITY_DN9785_c0_g1~~TRINITY_DN9785_c0_g1_i1.p1  ORF type:complete len:236 (+),score=42.48 TRINITY_DN9785_c0_g1_i1:28-708(+)
MNSIILFVILTFLMLKGECDISVCSNVNKKAEEDPVFVLVQIPNFGSPADHNPLQYLKVSQRGLLNGAIYHYKQDPYIILYASYWEHGTMMKKNITGIDQEGGGAYIVKNETGVISFAENPDVVPPKGFFELSVGKGVLGDVSFDFSKSSGSWLVPNTLTTTSATSKAITLSIPNKYYLTTYATSQVWFGDKWMNTDFLHEIPDGKEMIISGNMVSGFEYSFGRCQ